MSTYGISNDLDKKKTKQIDIIYDFSKNQSLSNYDLSWLRFNRNYLAKAINKERPLLEQLKHLIFFHNKLDEFFIECGASICSHSKNVINSHESYEVYTLKPLPLIRRTCLEQLREAHSYWSSYLLKELHEKHFTIKKYADLNSSQKEYINHYYNTTIYPLLTPQAIDYTRPLSMVSNLSLNFLIQLTNSSGLEYYARLKCPNNLPRFITIPHNKQSQYSDEQKKASPYCNVILLEEIICANFNTLFTGYTVKSFELFRVTRSNTNIKIAVNEAHDFAKTVQNIAEQNLFGEITRLEVSDNMPNQLIRFLREKFSLNSHQVYKTKGILGFSELIALLNIKELYPKSQSLMSKV